MEALSFIVLLITVVSHQNLWVGLMKLRILHWHVVIAMKDVITLLQILIQSQKQQSLSLILGYRNGMNILLG